MINGEKNITEELLTNQQAAHFLKISAKTLANWRSARNAKIPYIKIGRTIRYRKEDLLSYIAANTVALGQ